MNNSWGYLIKEGFRSIKANRQMSIASIGILMACMLLIGAAVIFSLDVNEVVGYVESRNEIVAYVKDGISDEENTEIGLEIAKIENVAEVTYVSKEAALNEVRASVANYEQLLQALEDDNPLPASYRIKLKQNSDLKTAVGKIEAINYIDSVTAPTDVANTIANIKKSVNFVGAVLVIILGLVSVIIISNTIKVTVFNRRREINIMKYVGATDTFIRLPFLVEGVIIGLTAALLAFLILWIAYSYVVEWISSSGSSWMMQVSANFIPFTSIALEMLGGFVAAGCLFGIAGALFFVSRHLKV